MEVNKLRRKIGLATSTALELACRAAVSCRPGFFDMCVALGCAWASNSGSMSYVPLYRTEVWK